MIILPLFNGLKSNDFKFIIIFWIHNHRISGLPWDAAQRAERFPAVCKLRFLRILGLLVDRVSLQDWGSDSGCNSFSHKTMASQGTSSMEPRS